MSGNQLHKELERRRTFAIISHPDAGKTTLTEKLLLYAGMIHTAGMVHARKTQSHTSSDWMKMEQERGISITASAMQFIYKDVVINVLDTPGHQDFSEDTYRTLTAADCAVMVIDAASGVETQTRKLFQVCRMRGIPIMTFINKMDLPGRDPLDLIAEVEEVLDIQASPLHWPVGSGEDFVGVVELETEDVLVFEPAAQKGSRPVEVRRVPLQEALSGSLIPDHLKEKLKEDLELLREAGNPYNHEQFLAGNLTPVFFGSALTNFGVEPFFDNFARLAPMPRPREGTDAEGNEIQVKPEDSEFTAYVFKIQANMDLRHRDSMAYLRVCSGRFERDITVKRNPAEKQIRLSRSHNMFGGERTILEVAYPGDIVGVVNPGVFAIGDTVSARGDIAFKPLPKFPPEVVARLRPKDVMKRKAFEKGMKQFRAEGAVLILDAYNKPQSEPLVAAVGPLQFEVLQYRLKTEYSVDTELELLPYTRGAWLIGDAETFKTPSSVLLAEDATGQVIMLYTRDWERNHALELNDDSYQLKDFIE